MAWTVDSSGTQTATVGAEHTLASSTSNGTFVGEVDLGNLANGDLVEIRVLTVTLGGDGYVLLWKGTFQHAQVCPKVQAPPVASDQGYRVTLKQVAGTGRSFKWKILRT